MIRIGNKVEGVIYTKRPASYVIIERKEDKKIAIATEGKTYFFLGGGIENDETELEALKRELIEESGYNIKNIKYFDSQPWPYPNSIMIGFTAEYESGEIKVDGEEILHADWYSKDNLPILPDKTTIARRIIDSILYK